MLALISFLITVLLILALSRLVNRCLSYILPDWLYKIILWPGVVIHELSHLLGAVLTFTKVTGFSILPRIAPGSKVLGSLSHQSTSNPLTLVVISIFPFLGGSFILWLLSLWLVPQAPVNAPNLVIGSLGGWWLSLSNYLLAWWNFFWSLILAFDFTAFWTWIFVYLALTIVAHLAPSNKDLSYTAAGLTAISLFVILVSLIINLIGQQIKFDILGWVAGAINFFTPLVSYSLSLLIIFAVVVGLAAGIKRLNNIVVWWG